MNKMSDTNNVESSTENELQSATEKCVNDTIYDKPQDVNGADLTKVTSSASSNTQSISRPEADDVTSKVNDDAASDISLTDILKEFDEELARTLYLSPHGDEERRRNVHPPPPRGGEGTLKKNEVEISSERDFFPNNSDLEHGEPESRDDQSWRKMVTFNEDVSVRPQSMLYDSESGISPAYDIASPSADYGRSELPHNCGTTNELNSRPMSCPLQYPDEDWRPGGYPQSRNSYSEPGSCFVVAARERRVRGNEQGRAGERREEGPYCYPIYEPIEKQRLYNNNRHTVRRGEWRNIPANSFYDTPVKSIDGRTWPRPHAPQRIYPAGSLSKTPTKTSTLSPQYSSTPVNTCGVTTPWYNIPKRPSEHRPEIIRSKDSYRISREDTKLSPMKPAVGTEVIVKHVDGPDVVSAAVGALKVKRLQKRRTLIAMFVWTLVGILSGISNRTTNHWMIHFFATRERLSRIYALDGAGVVVGAILSGASLTCYRGNAEPLFAIAMVMMTSFPCSFSVMYFAATTFITGVAKGIMFVCSVELMAEIWSERQLVIWIHLLFIAYAVGCAISVYLSVILLRYSLVITIGQSLIWMLQVNDDNAKAPTSNLEDHTEAFLPSNETVGVLAGYQQIRIHFLYLPLAAICVLTSLFLFYNSIYTCKQKFRIWRVKSKEKQNKKLQDLRLGKCSVTAQSNNYVDVEMVGNARSASAECIKTSVKKDSMSEADKNGDFETSARASVKTESRSCEDKLIHPNNGPVPPEKPNRNKKKLLKSASQKKENDSTADQGKLETSIKSENSTAGDINSAFNPNNTIGSEESSKMPAAGQNNENTSFLDGNNSQKSLSDLPNATTDKKDSIYKVFFKNFTLNSKKNPANEKELKNMKIENKEENITPWFKSSQSFDVAILMHFYVFFTIAAGLESALGRFIPVYTESFIKINVFGPAEADSSLMLFAFWTSLALGRLLAVSLTPLLPPNAVMIFCLLLNLLSSAILSAYGHNYSGVLWLFICSLGCALGPILPGGLTWANIFIPLRSPKSVALVFVMIGIGMALCSWVSGFVVGYFDGTSLMFLSTALCGMALLLYVPIMVKLGGRAPLTIEDGPPRKLKRTYV